MKKHTKQLLAMLLAVCSLVTFAMPTVFATAVGLSEDAAAETPASLTVNFATAFENAGVSANTYLQNAVSQLNAAYETNKWTVYCDSTGTNIKPNNSYAGGRNRANYLEIRTNKVATYGTTATLAFVFKAPGTGDYNLSVTYGTASVGDNKVAEMGAYILEKPAEDYTKYTIPGPNNPDILTKASKENPYVNGTGSGTFSAEGTVALVQDKEYVIVFYGIAPDETAEAYAQFTGFSLNYDATEEPDNGDEEVEDTREPVEYLFYTEELSGKKIAEATADIKAAYDAGTTNWRYEGSNFTYQFRPGGSNNFASGTHTMEYVGVAGNWFAVRIQSPGAGEYNLTYTHSAKNTGAKKGGLYILKASAVDGILGEEAATYAEAIAADPYTANNTEANDKVAEAIANVLTENQSIIDSNYYAESITMDITDTGRFTFEADIEYIVVFKAEEQQEGVKAARLLATSLKADPIKATDEEEEPTEPSEPSEPTEVPDDLVVNVTTDMNTAGVGTEWFNSASLIGKFNDAYAAGTIQWTPYIGADGKNVHSNGYAGGGRIRWNSGKTTAVIEITNNTGGAAYVPFKFKAPGTGNYKLSIDYTWLAEADIDPTEGGAYILAMPAEGYTGATLPKETDSAAKAVAKITYGTRGTYESTSTVALVEGQEYLIVFYGKYDADKFRMNLSGFSLKYSEDEITEEPEEPTEPTYPEGPGYTEGTYDFYLGKLAGSSLNDGKGAINAWYEAGTLNWNYYAKHGSVNLAMTKYISEVNSMYAEVGANWWLAFKIKAPAEDGAYDMKMVHGLKGDGSPSGSIFVLPGDTAVADIEKAMVKAGAAVTANWSTGEGSKKADVANGGETTTGSVNLRGGQEYIVVIMSNEKCLATDSKNGSFLPGQLTVVRTGDYVEDEGGEDVDDGTVKYEFYDYDNPGNYVNHYKTEADLGKKILTTQIAEKYAAGELNWTYQASNGYAQFASSSPYMSVTVGETYYYVLKIKSPGTGTYEITYDHYVTTNAKAGLRGSIYILPVKEGMDFAAIRGEADFLDPVISTAYKADKAGMVQVTGTYTAFQEDKEYFICFSVEDDDNTKNSSLYAYPASLTMKRTGEYAPVDGDGGDYGTVYKLPVEEFIGKRHDAVQSTIAQRYANGTMNWKLESGVGSATFNAKYVQFGTAKAGNYWAIRIKAPGTGMYKVTLKNMLGTAVNAASTGHMVIFEAPENTIASGSLADYASVNMPVTEFKASTSGTRFVKASQSGEYGFVKGKEYIVAFYGFDESDSRNETKSTYFYIDRLVMQRIGDYTEPEKAPHVGGIIAKDVVTEFKVGTQMVVTMNDRDYLVLCVYGGTMLIYDLVEWRLVDEVDFSAVTDTPRTICIDDAGNWWLTGATQSLFRYNPYTREGYNTGKVTGGGNNFEMVTGDDGYLYFGAYVSTGLAIYKYDPVKLTHEHWIPEKWAKYPGAVKQKGDYVYTAVSGDGSRYEIWKMNKYTGKIVDRTDISHMMNGERYVNGMSWLGEDYLMAVTPKGWTVVDIHTMEMMSQEEIGLRGYLSRVTSEIIDGKVYFVSTIEGVCYFDIETKEFGVVGGELVNFKTGLRSACYASIEDTRLTEKSLITFGGMSADGLNIKAINLETKSSVELIGLVEPGFGEGMNAHTIFNGAPGSNEIIYGPMYPDYPARVYNIETGELAREFMTAGQNDSYLYYDGYMYFGNYTGANLTRMENGKAVKLFTLNDKNFHQSRIHGLAAGDNKIFAGTIPSNFDMGGVIAWYDLDTELTYVVTGPNPEDVYYTKASKIMTDTNKWYRASNDEFIEDMSKEWDKDLDGDGVNQYFKGPIPYQSIIKVCYSDGLLYGFSTRRAGTGYAEPTYLSAEIFIYDVENLKMLKTVDIRDYIDGLPATVRMLYSLEVDPDISNKLWGVVSETLFSMTYDRDTNKVDIKVELSYDRTTISPSQSIPHEMVFDGDYMYILFGARGGLRKINRKDISDNTLIMGDFQRGSQVPDHFVLGDDGDIYYISGDSPHIYVLNVEVTEEELAEAQAVQDMIAVLPVNVTIADRDAIFAAREAWEAMDPANQPFVNNYDKLVEAEVALLQVRVDDLGEITIEDEAELVSIRTTYMSLDKAQRAKIDFMKVSEAESEMSILRGIRTSDLIATIGTVTLDDEQLIRDARASFMALTRYERTLVTNEAVLNAAEAVLTGLMLEKNQGQSVAKKINEIGFVFFSNTKIEAARTAYDKLSDASKAWVDNYNTLITAEVLFIAEYVLAVAILVCGAVVVIIAIRKKGLKKAKAE